MSDRREKLSKMLDTTLKSFTTVLSESKDLAKLTRHSEMKLQKNEIDAIMARLIESTQKKVQEKTSKLIDENRICERFDQLEQLVEESEEMNKKLGRDVGYNFVKPKRDIAFHLAETVEDVLTEAETEIGRLEKELEAEDEEFARRKQILTELATVVESQQQKLWKSAEGSNST
uniref:Mediator of RNA polymerase II transcription subunit 21 n=1 Tax=Caenorhabditis tropicalis TaxID=1561998 RepID=A0A1I7TEJ6_9PELO